MGRTPVWIVLLLAGLGLHAVLLVLLPGDGSWVEAVYAERLYPLIAPVVAFGPSLLPFSLSGILIVALLVGVPGYLAVNLLRWRRGRLGAAQAAGRTLLAWLVVGSVIFHGSYLVMGYHYLRPPLEQRLGLAMPALSPAAHRSIARHFVQSTVDARVPVGPWDRAELDRLLDAAMERAVTGLEGRPPPVLTPLKSDLGSGVLALSGYRGVVSPLTLEAHVDMALPPIVLAFTAAHEKAHLAGYARERDANFIAWYALTRSADPRLRYAGHFGLVHYFLGRDTADIAGPLAADLARVESYRAATVSRPIQRGTNRVYNAYLKANRMESGIGDYARVSDLVRAWLVHTGEFSAGSAAATAGIPTVLGGTAISGKMGGGAH